jgi:hypothetical protein
MHLGSPSHGLSIWETRINLMSRKLRGLLLGLSGGIALLPGCQFPSSKSPYPRDPVLVSKAPTEGKGGDVAPVIVAYTEPRLPMLPVESYVSTPPAFRTIPGADSALARREPARFPEVANLTSSAKTPLLATPVARSKTTPDAMPLSRPKSNEIYGHAEDHSWLQGVVEVTAKKGRVLEYCPSSATDIWGGRVILENDPRLGNSRSGDVLLVEGTMIPATQQAQSVGSSPLATYRIKSVWLVGRKD